MRTYTGSTAIQRNLGLAIPVFAMAWLVTVPSILTTSGFLTVVAILIGFGWIVRNTVLNGRPAASLAQILHDTERGGSLEHRPRDGR